MGDKSGIEWTDATWNPTVGCKRVSAGCDHCYAFQLHDQRHVAWKRGRMPDAPAQYHKPFSQVQLMPDRLLLPLGWGKPRRVFVNSMSDLFEQRVPDDFILRAWATMALTPQHTYQILTKRPERMRDWVRGVDQTAIKVAGGKVLEGLPTRKRAQVQKALIGVWTWPLPNVWLGTSVEDQRAANERIPFLLQTPAAVRFLSCEPLLGPIGLAEYISPSALGRVILHHQRTGHLCGGVDDTTDCDDCDFVARDGEVGIHWVIVGGESGPHFRAMNLDWARSLRDQCQSAEVAFFFKQIGGHTPKANGRELDGREWSEYPEGRIA